MDIKEIMNLNNVIVEEIDNYIYVTPINGVTIYVEDYPENQIINDQLVMLKQDEYSNIIVVDSSVYDASKN